MQNIILTLRALPSELWIAPHIGGSIARFDYLVEGRRLPVLRGCDAPQSPLQCASFPLAPFANRIRGGRFGFRGRTVQLRPNMAGDPSPLHGQSWLARWTVTSQAPTEAELSYRHEPDDWPWRYEARQHFSLAARSLTLELSCRNLSEEPMPCGLGQHPYFPCTSGTRIDTEVEGVWIVDEQILPVARAPVSGRYALDGQPVCGRSLDNGYDGWSGEARFTDVGGAHGTLMSSPGTRWFQLYSPAQGGFFVAEPVTHANAALNEPEGLWPSLGIRVLDPGESMTLRMRIDIDDLSLPAGRLHS